MKRMLMTLVMSTLVISSTQAARKNALEKEMEDYARDLYRAHPEAAGDKKPRSAAEDMVNEAKRYKLLELTKDEQKMLRKRQDIVSKSKYNSTLTNLKSLNSKDPKITFLIAYAENEKIKSDEKLLAYRLMEHNYKKAAEEAARARSKRMAIILSKYTAYKENNDGKAPASLSDLELPEDCQKFVNSKGEKVDWIYFGHLGPVLKTDNSHVVLVEPEPLGDSRVCGLDDGNVSNFKNSQIEPHIKKLQESMNDGSATPAGGATNAGQDAGALAGFMKRYKVYKELNNNKEPSSIDELNLKDADKKYTDPATGEKLDWIFLGASSSIRVDGDVKVIVVAPKPHGDNRLAGLSNGKVVNLQESQIGPMLKN